MDAWSSYQEMPHDQVDWANLAQQWMAMKDTEPVNDGAGATYDGGGPWEAGKPMFPSANLPPERYNHGPNDGYNNRGGEYWGDEWGQGGNGHFRQSAPLPHPYGAPNNYPPFPRRSEPLPYHQPPPQPLHQLRNGGFEPFREPVHGYDQFHEPSRGYDRYRDSDQSGSWIPSANHMPSSHRPPMHSGPPLAGGPPMHGVAPHGFFNQPRPFAHTFDNPQAGPIGGTVKPATPPMFSGNFADLDANARKKLPAWILEGLEKAEREKQKQTEKEERIKRVEEERARRRALTGKGKFDSDSEEENDDADDERSRTVSAPLFEDDGDPVFKARKFDSDEDLRTEEEKRADAMAAVKFIMMSLLMESTDILLKTHIDSAIKSSLVLKKEAAPKLISKSSALAALSSLGDDDDEESASDVEDSNTKANGDSNTNDAVTFKAPLSIPRNFSKPDPPKTQGTAVPAIHDVDSSSTSQTVNDGTTDTGIGKTSEERKRKRSRSRSREKKRSRSKERDRKRSRSRDREKKRSRSKERKRSRSRDRKRSRSKERRRRSRSGSNEKKRSSKKSRDRKRSRSRSRSRERRHRIPKNS